MLRTRKSPICSWNVMSTRVHAGRSCYRTITLPLSLLTKDVHAPVSKECCELSVDGRVDTKHWRYQCDDISATRPTFVFRVPVCISRRLSLRSLTSLSRGGSVLGGMRGWATWCQAKGVVNRVPPASSLSHTRIALSIALSAYRWSDIRYVSRSTSLDCNPDIYSWSASFNRFRSRLWPKLQTEMSVVRLRLLT